MKKVIEVDNVGKKLCRSIKRGILYGISDSVRMGLGFPPPDLHTLRKDEFWALRNVSFNVGQGETVGLIGGNGSGKTTLLRLINGIYPLSEGKVTVRGRVAPLIGVGAAFHAHLSGRENIEINAALLGMSRQELKQALDSIVDFAEIPQSLGAPLASYSTGMIVRLGFAIAVHCNVDIILADEILAVGDVAFQAKCLKKISELRNKGVSTILVSHDMERILAHCDRALLVSNGKLLYNGEPLEGVNQYKNIHPQKVEDKHGKIVVSGIGGVEVINLELQSDDREDEVIYPSKDGSLVVKLKIENSGINRRVKVRTSIRASKFSAEPVFVSDALADDFELNLEKGSSTLECRLQQLNFINAKLSLDIQIRCSETNEVLYWVSQVPISSRSSKPPAGFLTYPTQFELRKT